MSEIPDHILALQKIEGFTQTFLEIAAYYRTYEDAYEAVERLHVHYFGQRKYSNYNSYHICRDRYYKNR